VLDGVDVDSGTASEIGFAAALRHVIFGIRTDFRRSGENEASIVNPQVQWWIEQSGGHILGEIDQLLSSLRQRQLSDETP
jgi:nucleoside 2-deoxyribosyltransferase